MRRVPSLVAAALVIAGCASGRTTAADPTTSPAVRPASSVDITAPRPTFATTTIPTLPETTTTTTPTPTSTTTRAPTTTTAADTSGLAGISMTVVPPDVIVPTSNASLDKTNPINGGRGGAHPVPDELACADGPNCLTGTLDTLGFDVTGGSAAERPGRLARATAVVQLDAGLPATGRPDDALAEYLRPDSAAPAAETRRIGTSAQGRPIAAVRYGSGPRTVLVVGQTHGDEEGGLRVLLRARSLPLPAGITLWVVPTMNPDGGALDTRFLADGADPNRNAPGAVEQKAVYDFALAVRPALTVWYHQNYGWVGGSGASMTPAQRYQALTKLGTLKHSGDCAVGFEWCPIDDAIGSSSILVELPDVLTPVDVQTHAAALLAVAADAGS